MIAGIELESKMNEIRKRLAELDGVTGDVGRDKRVQRKKQQRSDKRRIDYQVHAEGGQTHSLDEREKRKGVGNEVCRG
jgi:hypothetical protein